MKKEKRFKAVWAEEVGVAAREQHSAATGTPSLVAVGALEALDLVDQGGPALLILVAEGSRAASSSAMPAGRPGAGHSTAGEKGAGEATGMGVEEVHKSLRGE